MNARQAAVLALACATLVACATAPAGRERVAEARRTLAAAPVCCTTLAEAKRQPLPLEAVRIDIGGASPAFVFDAVKSHFALFELPTFAGPYSVTIRSHPVVAGDGATLFVPRVALYDAAFRPTRSFDEHSLRNRGQALERTVFVNPRDATERFLAIYGADVTSSTGHAYSTVSQMLLPIGPGLLVLYQGQDHTSTITAAPVGTIEIEPQMSSSTP
jgi:hypothetical protein